MNEIEALTLLDLNRERYRTFLTNTWSHSTGPREVRGIPRTERAEVAEILSRVTVRLRDWQ